MTGFEFSHIQTVWWVARLEVMKCQYWDRHANPGFPTTQPTLILI